MTKKRVRNILIIFLMVSLFWFRGYIYIVHGNSMAYEYNNGSVVFVRNTETINRYDVVVVVPESGLGTTIIKRVIGLPGDVVRIKNGYVMINGKYLLSDTVHDRILFAGIISSDLQLGSDEYFLMGDNRNHSEDSRYAWLGPVKKEQIVGRVM